MDIFKMNNMLLLIIFSNFWILLAVNNQHGDRGIDICYLNSLVLVMPRTKLTTVEALSAFLHHTINSKYIE